MLGVGNSISMESLLLSITRMEEFRKQSKLTGHSSDSKRKDAWKEMRRVIEERRRQKKMAMKLETDLESDTETENHLQEDEKEEKDEKEERNSSILNNALKEEKRRESEYRKIEEAISPAPSRPSSASVSAPASSSHHENGWNQGDGRRAEQLVIYEGNLPEAIRRKIEPAKGTHFRFRHSSDEQKLMEALSSNSQTAVYQTKGKKDVTITSPDGQLIGNVHFLHMDGPDIHRPEKYYVKFYLFNFTDSNALRQVKQTIQQFFKGLSSSPLSAPVSVSASRPRRFIKHTRRARHHKGSHKKRRSNLRP